MTPITVENNAAPDKYKVEPLRMYVVGGGMDYIRMFFEAGFRGAKNLDEADVVCFTGGEDVDPQLYGERALTCTRFNTARDQYEMDVFANALQLDVPMIGICRGAQFLNVMNSGKLWQDVNNHAICGTHPIIDQETGEEIPGMTSTHHQQMIPNASGKVLALAGLSTNKISAGREVARAEPALDDVEVVWYEETASLCFQPHPEYSHGQCRDYFLGLVDKYVLDRYVDTDEDDNEETK